MPKTKLKSIELTYFRGATLPVKIEFALDKKVTLIYGENGCGKSSVVDAFDFLCEQDFGSLNDRKGADTRLTCSRENNATVTLRLSATAMILLLSARIRGERRDCLAK